MVSRGVLLQCNIWWGVSVKRRFNRDATRNTIFRRSLMEAKTLHFGWRKLLVTRVNPRQYGHLALEILMSLLRARREQATVYFLRPPKIVSEALFNLRAVDVEVLPKSRTLDAVTRASWTSTDVVARCRAWRIRTSAILRYEFRKEIINYLHEHKELPQAQRRRLGWVRDSFRVPSASKVSKLPLYYKRRLLRERVPIRMCETIMPAVQEAAHRVGLDLEKPIITLHVREAGFKFGNEMQDAKPGSRDDSTRNARIESYFKAIDFLTARGFTVVRIGDPSMEPVQRRGVIDLATSSHRSQALEIYCMWRSAFFVSAEAGPVGVSYLTNTPLLTVNATDPISSYPIRADGMLLLKNVRNRQTGVRLSPADLLTADYLGNLRNLHWYAYEDNTSEQIYAAVVEMLESLGRPSEETDSQRHFRELATEAGTVLRSSLNYVRKWGSDDGFLGDGRIVRSYVEKSL